MRRRFPFAFTVIGTIALPVAANTLIFAIVRGVLLDPLPLPQSDRLVRVEQRHASGVFNLTGATFVDVREQAHAFSAIAAFRTSPATISNGVQAIQASATAATADYTSVLGVRAVAGRLPDAPDFAGNGAPIVFISTGIWSWLLGADPSAVGRTILVNAAPRTIAGVLNVPSSAPGAADVWIPYGTAAPLFRNRRAQLYTTIARLEPGLTADTANAELDAIARRIRTAAPEGGTDFSIGATPLKERLVAGIRGALTALWTGVALLLLVAGANVANLLSMDGARRMRELSIRAALGATRARLIRQLALETMALALAGAAVGTALGAFTIDAIKPLLPGSLPRVGDIAPSPGVIAYGIIVSVLVVIAFGLWPAIAASRRDAAAVLRTREGIGTSRLRDIFVAAQVAMTIALLAGAAVLGRSFAAAGRVPLGFDPDRLIAADVSLPGARYAGAQAHALFYDRVLERLVPSPDLGHVGVTGALPLSPTAATTMIAQDGREDGNDSADVVTATPDLFAALHIPLVRGRIFAATDSRGAQPVVVVNETAARQFWRPGIDPLGRAVEMRDWGAPYAATVIGIVGDVRQNGPDQPVDPIVYYPLAQFPETTLTETIVAVSAAPLPRVVDRIRSAVAAVDSDQPIARLAPMTDRIASALAGRRFNFVLLAAFAGSALLLAGVGIYGTVAFAMAARTREIGLRVALGAAPAHITRLVVLRGGAPVVAGLCGGAAASILVARVVQGLVFGVSSRDPASLASAAVLLTGCALIAIAPAARRAATVDPVIALRAE
jgi:putative ABC transport system permease protein